MSKKTQHEQALGKQGDKVAVYQSQSTEETLLPPAEELDRLSKINPALVEFVMAHTSIEQNQRWVATNKKLNMKNKALTFAFILMLLGMGISAYLVSLGITIGGSIFGGVTLLVAITSFLQFGKKK